MARIPDVFIDDLLNRTDIVEIVGARVPLKKQGRDYAARCPFHDERSASFTVSPTKQFYHCFGCGAHGTALGFLMNYDRLEFLDAVEELAQRAGMEIPREQAQFNRPPDLADLHTVMESCRQFYVKQLARSDEARAYLDGRGLDETTITHFQIGFAPPGFDSLSRAVNNDAHKLKMLTRGGMFSTNDRGHSYDKFRNRVMFPISDRRGRTIGFGGRVINPDDAPKYLNSPETALFHKGRELYGLWQVRQVHSKIPYLLVVEGYMDVVALYQHGIDTAVATLGTATTPEHAELLFRNSETVVFCFDGDNAGRKAAWKAVESVLPRMKEGRQAFFMFLPNGEDPDSMVRKEGKLGFENLREAATPMSRFFIEHLSEGLQLQTLEGRSRFAEITKPYLAQLPDGSFRDLMQAQVDEIVGLSSSQERAAPMVRRSRNAVPVAKRSLVRSVIALLMQQPSLALELQPPYPFAALKLPGIDLLCELLMRVDERPEINTGMLLESFEGTEHFEPLSKLAATIIPSEEEILLQEFNDAITQLEIRMREQRLGELQEKQRRNEMTALDIDELMRLLKLKSEASSRT